MLKITDIEWSNIKLKNTNIKQITKIKILNYIPSTFKNAATLRSTPASPARLALAAHHGGRGGGRVCVRIAD
ncbi:MAG: hypothetical protein PVG40_12390 [Desulfobacterales bacterium]|jgi:hypothetical protein